ncbi:hypothetical protein GCM10023185_39300 [Hymenobacter saemangeumensis]|uniref:Uncharacterized protein n=1 Tax=Hymenobacter saemangeumensis TaxID=1084522 RepID=A0ABP8IQQ7_9BACT
MADAQQWYKAQAGPLKPASFAARSSSAIGSGPLPIDWANAIDTTANNRAFVFAPFRELGQGFTNSGYQTFRYLLLTRPTPNLVSGAVVEVLWQRNAKPSKAAQRNMLAKLYTHYRSASGNPPANFTGFVFYYTQDYQYRTGKGYVNGRPLPGRMQLVADASTSQKNGSTAARTSGCTTYRIVSHDPPYNVTVCQDQPDFGGLPDLGQPGFFDPGYGGGAPDYPSDPGSGPGTGSGGTSSEPPLNISMGNLRPCAGQVATNIQALANQNILLGGPIARLINAIAANPNIRVTFGEAPNLQNAGVTVRALTSHTSGTNSYTITMNADFLQGSGGATDLAIASDIIHELLHVYMMDWADQNSISPNLPLSVLMDMFFDPSRPNAQHETMATMVGYMGDALLQYYSNTFISSTRLHAISQNYAQSLSWGGLESTSAFQSHATRDPNWATQIRLINQAERHPDTAGNNTPTPAGVVQIPSPYGAQPCQ